MAALAGCTPPEQKALEAGSRLLAEGNTAGALCLAPSPPVGQAQEAAQPPQPRILQVEDKSALREFEVDAVKV
ncbi:MAG: hypothetical protein VX509_02330, partial [Verrucomicrobiota bacterium]|nr:hypothetical protein [Verrucomicrobiota bacterium]